MAFMHMLFPGGRVKAFTMSYDDGVEQDARLIEIMRRYGLKGTFNLSSGWFVPDGTVYPEGTIHRRLPASRIAETYAGDDIEVAIHGYEHPHLDKLTNAGCAWQVIKDRENLEGMFGRIVRGMAYPYGTYNDSVVETLRKCGIAYCRTVESTHDFELPQDWLRLGTTCHHNDPELMQLGRRFLEMKPYMSTRLFYLWGHSFEFEANDNWNVIEEFAELISGHPEVWYATNIEIYSYIEAYNSLMSSADGRRVYNPTLVPLDIELCGEHRTIGAGETLVV